MMDIYVSLNQAQFQCGPIKTPCSFGRGGWKQARLKREGDDATPLGRFPLRYGYYRPDKLERPQSALDFRPLNKNSGWCDDCAHIAYNQPITHPFPASAEHLWRDDALYDLILVIGHNDAPVQAGFGSAIFIHIAKETESGLRPTRGCIALPAKAFLKVIPLIGPASHVHIRV